MKVESVEGVLGGVTVYYYSNISKDFQGKIEFIINAARIGLERNISVKLR